MVASFPCDHELWKGTLYSWHLKATNFSTGRLFHPQSLPKKKSLDMPRIRISWHSRISVSIYSFLFLKKPEPKSRGKDQHHGGGSPARTGTRAQRPTGAWPSCEGLRAPGPAVKKHVSLKSRKGEHEARRKFEVCD